MAWEGERFSVVFIIRLVRAFVETRSSSLFSVYLVVRARMTSYIIVICDWCVELYCMQGKIMTVDVDRTKSAVYASRRIAQSPDACDEARVSATVTVETKFHGV